MTGIESPIAFRSCVTKPKKNSNFLVSDFLKSYPESLKHLPETKKKNPQIFTNKLISVTLMNTGITDKIPHIINGINIV